LDYTDIRSVALIVVILGPNDLPSVSAFELMLGLSEAVASQTGSERIALWAVNIKKTGQHGYCKKCNFLVT